MRNIISRGLAPASILLLSVSACDWVDSTGAQQISIPGTAVFLDDAPVGDVLVIEEDSPARILTSRDAAAGESLQFTWSDLPLAEGALDSCASIGSFDQAFAADSLEEACTDLNQCSVEFVQMPAGSPNVDEFLVSVPVLSASVGLRHELTVTDSAGELVSQREYDLCLIAINDPPTAVVDTFVVVEGTRLVVLPDATTGLLSNDFDDIDVTNDPSLTVLSTAEELPDFAAFFQLRADGGFTYEYGGDPIETEVIDTFDYTVTDGVSSSSATVTLRVVASNQAPQQLDDLPLFSAVADDEFEFDLGQYFVDPEGISLAFSADDSTLPVSGNIELSEDGILSGEPEDEDAGSYIVAVTASDGGRSVSANVSLEISPAPLVPDNTPPVFFSGSVFNQTISLGQQIAVIRPLFVDPDGDELTYRVIGGILPVGVSINSETGVISGRPLQRLWVRNLRVEAEDEAGITAVSNLFFIRVL